MKGMTAASFGMKANHRGAGLQIQKGTVRWSRDAEKERERDEEMTSMVTHKKKREKEN